MSTIGTTQEQEPGVERPASTSVRLWRRSPHGRPGWTVTVGAGVTAEEVDRLCSLALEADRTLAEAASRTADRPEPGAA